MAHSNEVKFVFNIIQFISMPLVRALHACIFRSPLVKKKIARKYPERLGFPYTGKKIETYEKRKLRPTQNHNVLYAISNKGYLNRWRDKKDELQL